MPRRRFRNFATDAAVAVIALVMLDIIISGNASAFPTQCSNYSELTEPNRNVNFEIPRIPSGCDNKISQVGWYRFTNKTGNILATQEVYKGKCSAQNPGRLVGDHPCTLYETTHAHVCFVSNYKAQDVCKNQVNISITLCGHYYVYQLAAIKNCTGKLRMRYCGQDSSVPVPSCNYRGNTTNTDSTPIAFPTTKKVAVSSSATPKSDNNIFTELKEQVEELDRKNISTEAVQNIITKLSNLTDLDNEKQQEKRIKQQDLIKTVEILQKIVDLNISDGNLDILAPASNILDSRNRKSWKNMEGDKIVRNLINTLEEYGFQYGNISNSTSIFQNYSNVQLRVKYLTRRSNLSEEERLFKFQDTSFELSPAALPQKSGAVVVVLWYKTMHSILKTKSSFDYAKIVTKVITASIRPEPRQSFPTPIRIRWNTTGLVDSTTCVYWKPELNETEWKTDGCMRVKDKSDSNKLICECDHLTAFAAMDISRSMVSENERQALELISTIGCSVSLFGVVLTILTHSLLWKKLQQNVKSNVPSQVILHLCVAIGMTDILAILAGPARDDEKFCMTVSILLYFFVLAVFGWMLCEGIIIYLQLVNVYTGLGLGGRHLKVFYVIGWGFPVLIVSLLVALNDREDFITKRACWCRGDGVVFWTFVGTICLILLINLVIFVLALRSALSSSDVSTARTLRSTTKDSTGTTQSAAGTTLRKAKVALKGSAILLPILGLTWLFGLLVFNRDTIVFKYLFAICNSLQGMMIFLFHVVINKKVSEAIRKEKKTRKDKHMNNIAINNNTCAGTLSTSDVSRRKSSIPVTPTFFKEHFNGSESLAVKRSSNTENRNSSSQIPNRLFLEPKRYESKGRSRSIQNDYHTKKNNDSSQTSEKLYLEHKSAELTPNRNNCMRPPENIIVEDL